MIFQSEVFVGSGSSVYGGQLFLKSDTVRWILDGSTDTLSFTSAFYVGAGRLDIEFGSYSAISAPLLTDPPILPEDIANLYGGSLMWDETIEQPAPYLGYFEENLYGLPNTNVRIKVDRGIFGGLIAIHEGGYFEFFPGDLEVVAQLTGFELGTQTYGFYLGGPYDVITQSKFICHGGIINFIGVGDTYGEGIEFYDDPSFYFKDTQFIWDENHSAVNAIAYYGSNRDYARDLILDGAKFYVKSDDLSFMYPFKITPNFGEPSELQIRIYGNCFSNMNQFIVNPEDLFSTVVNLVPNTDFIVSDEVKLLKKYF